MNHPNETTPDPAISDFVFLTLGYRGTLIIVTLVTVVIALLAGYSAPRMFTASAIVQPAHIAPEGAVEDLEVSASRLETSIDSQVVTESLADGTALEVIVLRDQPPSSMPVDMLSLTVRAPTPDAAQKALRSSIEALRKSQNPLYRAELERLAAAQARLEKDYQRLSGVADVSVAWHEAINRVVIELSATERRQLRIRAHPVEVLAGPTVAATARGPRIATFGAIGFALGIALAYFIAFVSAGLETIRRNGTLQAP